MRRILRADYEQMLLLPPSLEEWIGPEHPARFVREFVAALDLKGLGLDTLEREEGGTAYEPALLVSAWLYGYLRKVRSTRALESACREEMGFVWLTGNQRPDHNALWRFWKEHRDGLRALFTQSVRVAMEMQLVGLAVQALDGTKIAAACSGRGGYDRKHLEKLLSRLDAEITEREQAIERAAEQLDDSLPEHLQKAKQLREQVRAALSRVSAGETKHAHPLEPQAARMPCDGRNRFGYNAQAVVDAQAQVVVAAEVVNAANDQGQLAPMLEQARANCAAPSATPTTLADGGYATAAQLEAARANGHDVLAALPASWRDTSDAYHAAHFRHDAQRQIVTCPQGRELPLQRVRLKDGRRVEVYRSAAVCRGCPVRAQCTSDRHGRSIDIAPGQAALAALHERWQHAATHELYGLRAPTVEPVFAQIKQRMGLRRWSVRGLPNVRVQWSLACTSWNLQVIYRHWRRDRGGPAEGTRPRGPSPAGRGGACGLRPALSGLSDRRAHPRLLRSSHRAPFFA
jgi:transposase